MITKCALFLTVALCLLTGGCNSATNKKVIQKQNPNQDVLEVLGTEPQNPVQLSLGERLQVHIGYQLNTIDKAYIWARPYKNGQKAPGYGAHHLIPVAHNDENSGFVTGWFLFRKPTEVDEVRVFMRDQVTDKIIETRSFPLCAKWTEKTPP